MRVTAIVPAAGASTRMGRPKQILPFGRTTILGAVLDTLADSGLEEIIVVLGHNEALVRDAIGSRPVKVVVNPAPERGMLSSIQCGLASSGETEAFLIALGDQPQLSNATVEALILATTHSPASLFLPTYDGRRGHPLLIRAHLRDEISSLPETVGLNALISSWSNEVVEVPVKEPDVLIDIDTPEEYEQAISTTGDRGES